MPKGVVLEEKAVLVCASIIGKNKNKRTNKMTNKKDKNLVALLRTNYCILVCAFLEKLTSLDITERISEEVDLPMKGLINI